jgi:hypothetical protein
VGVASAVVGVASAVGVCRSAFSVGVLLCSVPFFPPHPAARSSTSTIIAAKDIFFMPFPLSMLKNIQPLIVIHAYHMRYCFFFR